jgi:hypothetical protein
MCDGEQIDQEIVKCVRALMGGQGKLHQVVIDYVDRTRRHLNGPGKQHLRQGKHRS